MHVSARADYALRAVLAIADDAAVDRPSGGRRRRVWLRRRAWPRQIPLSVLHGILLTCAGPAC